MHAGAGIIVCFYCFDLPQFRGERMGATACLLWLFGAAGIACTYLFSFAFLVSQTSCLSFLSLTACPFLAHCCQAALFNLARGGQLALP